MSLDKHNVSASRWIADALTAEGVQGLMKGYQNIHKLPLFQKQAFGTKHFPWSHSVNNVSYEHGICPVAEELHNSTFLGLEPVYSNIAMLNVIWLLMLFKKSGEI